MIALVILTIVQNDTQRLLPVIIKHVSRHLENELMKYDKAKSTSPLIV